MDNRQLQVFVAVAHARSFTRAAAELHLVQSAVSVTIATLEADIGQRLFERTTRRVQLTAAGEALLAHATSILDAFRTARDALDQVGGGLTGAVRIGYMTNVTLFDIPRLLGRFHRDYPAVTMHLAPAANGTAGLAEGIRRGELDLAFLSASPQDYPELRVDVLTRTSLGLAVAAGHPLAGHRRLTLAAMTDLRFVDFLPGFGIRTVIDAEFRQRGLRRDVQVETADINDIAALVRNGLGVGFLPQYLVEADDGMRWIEICEAELHMHVSVATSRDRVLSAAAARLATTARDQTDLTTPAGTGA